MFIRIKIFHMHYAYKLYLDTLVLSRVCFYVNMTFKFYGIK